VEQAPERVAPAGEVVTDLGRAKAGVDPHEEDARVRAEEVG
jgi:hypothetical protein